MTLQDTFISQKCKLNAYIHLSLAVLPLSFEVAKTWVKQVVEMAVL